MQNLRALTGMLWFDSGGFAVGRRIDPAAMGEGARGAAAGLAGDAPPRRAASMPCTLLHPLSSRHPLQWIAHAALITHGQIAVQTDHWVANLANAGAAPPRKLCSGASRRRPACPFAQGRRIAILWPTANLPESNQSIPVSARRFCIRAPPFL